LVKFSKLKTKENKTTILACFHQELTEELGELEASSDEEAMVTTRVVRRRVIIQVSTLKLLHVGTALPFTK
jgi:hypothetical protein